MVKSMGHGNWNKKQRKAESSHERHNRQPNDGKVTSLGSLLGVPVKLSNGIADKNNNQTYEHKGSLGIQAGCLGVPAWGTEPKQLSVVEVYWNTSRIIIGLI